MKTINIMVLLVLCGALFSVENKTEGAGGLMWFTNIEDAVNDSKKSERSILVNFTGSDWCHWCFKLDDDVFSKKVFKEWQEENVTLLMIDFPQKKKLSDDQTRHNQILAQAFGIQGFPTIVILNSEGKYLGRIGYGSDVNKWIGDVETLITTGK